MEKKTEHFFYVLECQDKSYYAGYTNDLERRVRIHNEGKGAKYTRAKLPVRCIYYETYDCKREAMQAEYKFKQLTRRKKEHHMKEGKEIYEVTKKC